MGPLELQNFWHKYAEVLQVYCQITDINMGYLHNNRTKCF